MNDLRQDERGHRGITIHKMPVGGDVPGLIFVVICLLILIGRVPGLWFFFLLAIPVGIITTFLIRPAHRRSDVHPLEHL